MGIAAAVDIEPPRAALPSRYDVLVKDTRIGACYTHVFAVYPRVTTTNSNPAARQLGPNESQRRITAMYPTHGVIWAAHCARLPTMTREEVPSKLVPRDTGKAVLSVLRLPVVPLAVPYPEKFDAVADFVYNRLKSRFISFLLPTANHRYVIRHREAADVDEDTLVEELSTEYSLLDLCRLAKSIHGTYQNMIALWMVDDLIWTSIDIAWRAVRRAMEIVEQKAAATA